MNASEEAEHADLVRLGRLDRLAEVMTDLAARERERPGSVSPLAVEAISHAVHSWLDMTGVKALTARAAAPLTVMVGGAGLRHQRRL